MKKTILTILFFLINFSVVFAVPMQVTTTFSGMLIDTEQAEFYNLQSEFCGTMSYLYDEERSLLRDPDRNFYLAGEIKLSYSIHVGDWHVFNSFDSINDPPAHVSFDLLPSMLDEIPYDSDIDGLYTDMLTIDLQNLKVYFSGMNIDPDPPLFSLVGNILDLKVTITPIPEPATAVLFGLGILGVARVNRRRK